MALVSIAIKVKKKYYLFNYYSPLNEAGNCVCGGVGGKKGRGADNVLWLCVILRIMT